MADVARTQRLAAAERRLGATSQPVVATPASVIPDTRGALSSFLRADRDRYAAAHPVPPHPPRSTTTSDELIARLAAGELYVSSFDGTSQYSSGGPSACGLASMNAVMHVLLFHKKGARGVELLQTISRRPFHEGVIDICSFLSETEHLEIEHLHRLPLFNRSMSLLTETYAPSSYSSFRNVLDRLREHTENEFPVAAVITKAPEILAVICIPTIDASPLATHTYVVFDSHARPELHPTGCAFLFFPTAATTAAYLASLLQVEEALLSQGDLQWQSDMLRTFSAHIFAAPVPDETHPDAARLATTWSMLYETSVDLVQSRGRLAALEQEMGDLRRENAQLSSRVQSLQAERRNETTKNASHGFAHTQSYPSPPSHDFVDELDPHEAVEMNEDEYVKFWTTKEVSSTASASSAVTQPSNQYLKDLAQRLAIEDAEISTPPSSEVTIKGKGKSRQIDIPESWSGETSMGDGWSSFPNETWSNHPTSTQSSFSNIPRSLSTTSGAGTSRLQGSFNEDIGSQHIVDQAGPEARRLRMLEAQDRESRELALRLDKDERQLVARRYTYAPPALFPDPETSNRGGGSTNGSAHTNAGASFVPAPLSAVTGAAGAVAGFVGNKLMSFGRSYADVSAKPPAQRRDSAPASASASTFSQHVIASSSKPASSKAKPGHKAAYDSTVYLANLRQQMGNEDEQRSIELALRLQDEENTKTESKNPFLDPAPEVPLSKRPPTAQKPVRSATITSMHPISYPKGAVSFKVDRAASRDTQGNADPDSDRIPALKVQLEEQNRLKSLELIRQMEEEDRATQALINSFSHQEKFDCVLCMDETLLDDVAQVEGCGHMFCRSCLKGYLGSKLGDGEFPIMCPSCKVDKKSTAPSVIPSTLAEQLGLSEKEYEQWSKLDLQRYSVVIDCPHCRKSSCVDREDYTTSPIVTCPLAPCHGQWCKDCSQKVDPTVGPHSCDGQKEMDSYIRSKNLKRCPGCTTPVEKTMGCNHMTCGAPGCNTHFCWIDGENIITSQVGKDIKAAIERHYRKCKLFDYNIA